jgi:hypothetical protein
MNSRENHGLVLGPGLPNAFQIAFRKARGSNRNFVFQLYDGTVDGSHVLSSSNFARRIWGAGTRSSLARRKSRLQPEDPLCRGRSIEPNAAARLGG